MPEDQLAGWLKVAVEMMRCGYVDVPAADGLGDQAMASWLRANGVGIIPEWQG